MNRTNLEKQTVPASYIWFSGFILMTSLMLIGYSHTYPVQYSSLEMPVLKAISPLFWVGLAGCIICLAEWVQTTENGLAHYLSTLLFVLCISSPQLLFIAWGSDAGSLVTMVEYNSGAGTFDLTRDIQMISYFQWPASIFFHRFLSDLLLVDIYTAVRIGFILAILCVSSGMFLFWNKLSARQSFKTRWAFWGVVLYFTGLYWFHNWQASPYVFALCLFLPALALFDLNQIRFRIVFFLFIVIGMESHALFGLWLLLILIMYFITSWLWTKKPDLTLSIILFAFVLQMSLIIYKNLKFFKSLVLTYQGYYTALLETGASDKAIIIQARGAFQSTPLDMTGQILKFLGFVDLGMILFIVIIAMIYVIWKRILRSRETSLALAGFVHFMAGNQYAAIGTRSLQLLAFLPVSFVIDALDLGSKKIQKSILFLLFLALILFPSALLRSYQTSDNFIKASDLYIKNFFDQNFDSVGETTAILTEGIRPLDFRLLSRLIKPNKNDLKQGCRQDFFIIDSPNWRAQSQNLSQQFLLEVNNDLESSTSFSQRLDQLNASLIYSNGHIMIRTGNCQDLPWLYNMEK